MTAEVFDVFTGETCELPQLPDMREYHIQVIFDQKDDYLYVNIVLLEWKLGLWWR